MSGESPLAPWAASDATSRGRRWPEPPPQYRSEFQRDRDRIIHSAAFRRLEYKTQVFVNHEGDMFRTRLTHSLEVAQIGRTIARALQLNETLVEAIALAHDLGHTPFGHAGQDALNRCMADYGGFEHNLQSLRVVDQLEQRYADFEGLNLTFESREGILKHCPLPIAAQLGAVGERFIQRQQPSLEAQIANLADAIAYNSHDVDDGVRSGLITFDQLLSCRLFAEQHAVVAARYPKLSERRQVHEVVRRMIGCEVSDLITTSQQQIAAAALDHIETVRAISTPLIRFSEELHQRHLELKRFLRHHLYHHYRVHRMMLKAQRVITDLFTALMADPKLLPPDYQERSMRSAGESGEPAQARVVADYIAGMTDRYALLEHRRLFDPAELT